MSVDNEIYNQHAETWWSEDGLLHFLKTAIQPARFGYFERILTQVLQLSPQGRSLLDVGCGGGILAEDFARLGCQVTGVDPSAPSLDAARQHAEQAGLRITYRQSGGEALPFGDATFDIVCCCDVLEHVDDVDAVIAEIARVLRPGGVFFYDTINRTVRSRLIAIKVLQEWEWSSFMPPGLHDWSMFIKPEELEAILERKGLRPQQVVGIVPERHPLGLLKALRDRKKRKITLGELGRLLRSRVGKDTSVSYMGYAIKPSG
jgi:2-polyprenyl-6-hydroxyphenyl methylase / 3-demethylubiquinone-9 3-methyltransferase